MEEMPRPAAAPSPSPDDRRTPSPAPPPAWPHARLLRRIVTGLVLLAVALAAGGTWFYHTSPQRVDRQQTLVLGQAQFAPGSESALRVIVRDAKAGRPVPGADVRVSMAAEGGGPSVVLYSGKADADGALAASFRVPQGGQTQQTFIVETRSDRGHDEVRQAVTVQRSHKLLLTTDKPVYQPGQVIHLRALAFSTLDMQAAAGSDIGFLVEDPKGNKVFRQTVPASAFGIAAADFTLANEVIHGDYKLIASLGSTSTEKTVSVKPYVLPKFAVKVTTERSYYLPGERVTGLVQCDYFFGKPTAGAAVELVGSVFDVQQTEVVRIQGHTDAGGAYRFEFDLPTYTRQDATVLGLRLLQPGPAGHPGAGAHHRHQRIIASDLGCGGALHLAAARTAFRSRRPGGYSQNIGHGPSTNTSASSARPPRASPAADSRPTRASWPP
jgi:hypothetical protein